MVELTIDGIRVVVPEQTTILEASAKAGIYIPRLCFHPDLPTSKGLKSAELVFHSNRHINNKSTNRKYEGCQLCVVRVEGAPEIYQACITIVAHKMVVSSDTPEIREFRCDRLMSLLGKHPHACLTCTQKEGCAREPCSMNILLNERCCPQFGHCELQRLVEYVGIKPETPRYVYKNMPVVKDEPLFEYNSNLCIGCTRCVRVCRDLRGVGALDFVFDTEGRIIVGSIKPTLKDAGCRFCTACVEVCPTGALADKALFNEVPCKATCPAGIDVPRYIHLISEGKYGRAAAVIREKAPFPAVLGYICTHDCEAKCRRKEINDSISIRALKKFTAENDNGHWKTRIQIKSSTRGKVAIVGSGPAGLTAAYFLAKLGYSVTIFEAKGKAGGMMRTGIPRFLLPEVVLDGEINEILSLGIDLKLNSQIQNVKDLFKKEYDVALIAIGLQVGQKLPVLDNDLPQVLIGLDLLEKVNNGEKVKLGENVIVIGGGGVACDVARSILRLGVPQVSMVCLESLETMPATPWDLKDTQDEGVKILPNLSVNRILSSDDRVWGVECYKVKSMKFDEEGKLHLEIYSESEHVMQADTIIFAIGQALENTLIKNSGIEITRHRTIKSSPDTLETNLRGVFACGDAVSGPASVIEAIAAGRKAAMSINRYLGGKGIIDEALADIEKVSPYLGKEENFCEISRIDTPLVPIMQRLKSFNQVSVSLTEEQALMEAKRCLKCDLRFQLSGTVLPPKKKGFLEFSPENVGIVRKKEGVYQLLDERETVIYIKGTVNLRKELEEKLRTYQKARYFIYEEHPMYSKRENELLQQFINEHDEMPFGNQELDDLFE